MVRLRVTWTGPARIIDYRPQACRYGLRIVRVDESYPRALYRYDLQRIKMPRP